MAFKDNYDIKEEYGNTYEVSTTNLGDDNGIVMTIRFEDNGLMTVDALSEPLPPSDIKRLINNIISRHNKSQVDKNFTDL